METKRLIIGESAVPEQVTAIEKAQLSAPGVDPVIHLRTMHSGPDELLLAAKLGVGAADEGAEIAATIDDAEVRVRAAVPTTKVICLEPDVYRPDAAPPLGMTLSSPMTDPVRASARCGERPLSRPWRCTGGTPLQAVGILNQVRVFAVWHQAPSRINMAYVTRTHRRRDRPSRHVRAPGRRWLDRRDHCRGGARRVRTGRMGDRTSRSPHQQSGGSGSCGSGREW